MSVCFPGIILPHMLNKLCNYLHYTYNSPWIGYPAHGVFTLDSCFLLVLHILRRCTHLTSHMCVYGPIKNVMPLFGSGPIATRLRKRRQQDEEHSGQYATLSCYGLFRVIHSPNHVFLDFGRTSDYLKKMPPPSTHTHTQDMQSLHRQRTRGRIWTSVHGYAPSAPLMLFNYRGSPG